jgi:hypothetical protein
MYCPACREMYNFADPRFESVFGAFFGREYLGRIVVRHPQLAIEMAGEVYVPRIYGFRVLERPESEGEGE